jgi:cell division transport system ATP-binding protein
LDPANTFEIINILQRINELGTTILLTTHNKGVMDTVKGRIITMESGKIIKDDKNGKYEI